MTKHLKRPLSILLAVMMIVSVFVAVPTVANATADLSWIDENGTSHSLTYGTDGDNPTVTIDGTTTIFDQEWTSTTSLPTSSGNYYLANDVTYPNYEWQISMDQDVKIFLNGKTITHAAGTSRFLVQDQYVHGTLSIYGDGTITTNSGSESFAYMDTGTINMYGGTITGFRQAFDLNGNVYHMVYFNMYGGTITGNHAGNGGGVSVANGSEFRMYGGCIENNTATNGIGGGVAVYDHSEYGETKFIMTGGSIKNNTAATNGGGIYCKADNGDFCIRGDVDISGNTAAGNGDDLYLDEGKKLYITGALNCTDPISVALNTGNGVVTSGFSANGDAELSDCFEIDSSSYECVLSNGEVRLLALPYYTVTLLPGEAGGSSLSDYVEGSTNYTLPSSVGFTAPTWKMFSGWSDGVNTYSRGEVVDISTAGTEFTAQWIPGVQYLFDFEDGMPEGWQSTGAWTIGTGDHNGGSAHSGNNNMLYYVGGYSNSGDLLTPAFDLSVAKDATLGFWYTNRSWSGDTDQLVVSYRVGDGDWVQLFATNGNHESWTNEVINIPAEAFAENVQFRFRANGNWGYGIALDDVDIQITLAKAEVNGTRYGTLEEAIAAAQEGDTVTLLADTTVDSTINIDKNLTINGGDYTVTSDGVAIFNNSAKLTLNGGTYSDTKAHNSWTGFTRTIESSGDLVINGATVTSGGTIAVYAVDGTVTVNSGTVESAHYAIYNEGADVVINDGTIKSNGKQIGSSPDYAIGQEHGSTTVNGGQVVGAHGGILVNGGDLTVTGGSVSTTGSWRAIHVASAYDDIELNITGGTFSAPKEVVYVANGTNAESVDISGGTFTSTGNKAVFTNKADVETINVSGGTFSSSVAAYAAPGLIGVELPNGQYGVEVDDSISTAIIGYQKKVSDSAVRIITKVDDAEIADATEYGYVVASVSGKTQDGITNWGMLALGNGGKKINCKDTFNTIAGYGDGYVTLKVTGMEIDNQVVARFYYVKNGVTYYAKYATYDGILATY